MYVCMYTCIYGYVYIRLLIWMYAQTCMSISAYIETPTTDAARCFELGAQSARQCQVRETGLFSRHGLLRARILARSVALLVKLDWAVVTIFRVFISNFVFVYVCTHCMHIPYVTLYHSWLHVYACLNIHTFLSFVYIYRHIIDMSYIL